MSMHTRLAVAGCGVLLPVSEAENASSPAEAPASPASAETDQVQVGRLERIPVASYWTGVPWVHAGEMGELGGQKW